MPNYHRVKIKGGTYFFTIVTYERQQILETQKARDLFLQALQHVNKYHPFILIAYCIIPDHIHLLIELPENDDNYSMRIAEIKKYFTKRYRSVFHQQLPAHSLSIDQKRVWQNRFWEHYIRDQNDLWRHIDYIHYNPVKHHLTTYSKDWSSSSFSDFVQKGYYEIDWGKGLSIKD